MKNNSRLIDELIDCAHFQDSTNPKLEQPLSDRLAVWHPNFMTMLLKHFCDAHILCKR